MYICYRVDVGSFMTGCSKNAYFALWYDCIVFAILSDWTATLNYLHMFSI